ncbi:MAG: DUF222 domain-containing protein [Nocardioides sp.]
MAITPLPQPTPAGVVAGVCAEIDSIAGMLWSARPDGELVAGVEELQRLKAKTAALEASMLAEVEVRDLPRKQLAWGSTADWFTHLAGTTRRQGRRSVEHAKRLISERRATHAALAAGSVSPDQAGVIIDAVEQLPLAEQLRRRGEQVLLEEAGRLNATDLHRAGRHLAAVVDPDREEREAEKGLDREERAAHLGRHLSISEDGCGGVRIKGRGSLEDGALLRAALLPFTNPVPAVDPETCQEQPDPRDHGARMWDALVRLAQHALDTDLAPNNHGARPRVAVTVNHDTLHDDTLHDDPTDDDPTDGPGGSGFGVTEDGLDVPASAVRRMACDCDLIRVLLDAEGCVLDVGRTHRLVTPAIWTALVVRDQHCAFPGCTRPPVMCHAHHIRHWADGGPTALDNLVLLCGHHHRTIHHTPWQVRLGADGRPEFLPPAKPGRPPPTWIRQRPRIE